MNQSNQSGTAVIIDPVFYIPANHDGVPEIIDYALERVAGSLSGQFSGKTLEQLREQYPTIEIGSGPTVEKQREEGLKTVPVEITEKDFHYALEVLPPMGYVARGSYATFKMSEFYSGQITSVYASVEGKYFTFHDLATIKHDEIVEKVRAVTSAH